MIAQREARLERASGDKTMLGVELRHFDGSSEWPAPTLLAVQPRLSPTPGHGSSVSTAP